MEIYLAAVAAIIFMNALPAFAPPTWMALVFFLLHYNLNPVALVALGVLSATVGRGILAWYFRKFAHLIPTRFSRNMEYAGKYFESHPSKRYAMLTLFLVSPVSSAAASAFIRSFWVVFDTKLFQLVVVNFML